MRIFLFELFGHLYVIDKFAFHFFIWSKKILLFFNGISHIHWDYFADFFVLKTFGLIFFENRSYFSMEKFVNGLKFFKYFLILSLCEFFHFSNHNSFKFRSFLINWNEVSFEFFSLVSIKFKSTQSSRSQNWSILHFLINKV